MRARAPPSSTWRMWQPRNGISFMSPHTQPLYPDLSGHRSVSSLSPAVPSDPAPSSTSLQCETGALKPDSGCVAAPHVLQVATKSSSTAVATSGIELIPATKQEELEGVAAAEAEVEGKEPADVPPPTTLDFKADVELFRAAKQASAGSMACYWSYTQYRGPEGEKVKVHYCKSNHTTERVCQYFLEEKIIGFDLEWLVDANRYSGARRNVCLIQLASQSRIALFHIALYPKDDSLVAPSLKRLMEDPEVSKVGVNIKADCTRLRNWLGIDSRGIFELSHLYKLVKYSASGETHLINRRTVQLAEQVKTVLGLPMFKGPDVRSSDWSKPLTMEQIKYSSSDAYAAPQIFHILEQQREALDPTPPRPYHAELGLAIRLADGKASVASEDAAAEDVDVEGSGDASDLPPGELQESVPETVEYEADPDGDGVEVTVIKQTNTSETTAAMSTSVPGTKQNRNPKGSRASRATSRPKATPIKPAKDERVVAAEDWLSEYRATCKSPPKVAAAALRAYHIWSQNSDLDPAAIASLLRDPPLQRSTVTTYILEAIKSEKLPYENHRLREEVLALVPVSTLSFRYAALEQETRTPGTSADN